MLKECINKDKITTRILLNGFYSVGRLFFVVAVNIAAAYRFVDQLKLC